MHLDILRENITEQSLREALIDERVSCPNFLGLICDFNKLLCVRFNLGLSRDGELYGN